MDIKEQIKKEAQKNLKKVDTIKDWPKKMDAMKVRKKNPLTEAAFCQKYGFNVSRFNRYKNFKEGALPSDDLMTRINNAFKAERV